VTSHGACIAGRAMIADRPGGLRLLPRGALVKTGTVDHADWNYRPVLGPISRIRFKLALALLPSPSRRLLEVGYGSGIFMPELARTCEVLYGLDTHQLTG